MSRAKWIEMLLIGVLALLSWLIWPYLSFLIPRYQIVLYASGLLLMQSLIRDATILLSSRKSNKLQVETQCFCLETSFGVIGVLLGAVLALLESSNQTPTGHWVFFLITAGTLLFGFVIQDWVISWNPLGLRREKDHLNLIVRWRK